MYEVLFFSSPCQHCYFLFFFFIIAILLHMKWYLTGVLICISEMINDVEQLCMYFFDFCIYSLRSVNSCWHRLNVSVSSRFMCWNYNSQPDGIWRWGLWKVVRSWLWNSHDGVSGFVRRDTREFVHSLCFLSSENIRWLPSAKQEVGSHQTSGLPAPWVWNW